MYGHLLYFAPFWCIVEMKILATLPVTTKNRMDACTALALRDGAEDIRIRHSNIRPGFESRQGMIILGKA
jgi:hypothetical protein